MSLQATTWQTVGPYFRIGLEWLFGNDIAAGVDGQKIQISGRVLDADGKPIPDAMLEFWQANSQGKYAHPEDTQDKPIEPNFQGFCRLPTDEGGRFRFLTIKPGRVPGPDGKLQAPHIVVSVFMRGLLRRLVTRIYFPDDPANQDDFALNLVDPARRVTLIARKGQASESHFEWNVMMQGPEETVFFDC
jgi:protocatechuate 3,4-dioxygenase alpha subunit